MISQETIKEVERIKLNRNMLLQRRLERIRILKRDEQILIDKVKEQLKDCVNKIKDLL